MLKSNIQTNYEALDAFVLSQANSSVFHHSEFLHMINQNKNQEAFSFTVEKDTILVGCCTVTIQNEKGLKTYFSKRAIIYDSPLIVNNDPEILSYMLENLEKVLKQKVIYIEFRHYQNNKTMRDTYLAEHWKYLPYTNFELSLQNTDLETLLSKMKYNRRREIKISFKENAQCYAATNEVEIEELYQILKELYDTKVKLPLPDLAYFLNLFHSPCGIVFIVKHNDLIIGGSFCLFVENKNIYTLYYCGIRNYNKKIFPTHLAIIAAIEFGLEKQLVALDFMGAGLENEEYGVRDYKAEFGGTFVTYGRHIKIIKPFLYAFGKFGLKMLKKIS